MTFGPQVRPIMLALAVMTMSTSLAVAQGETPTDQSLAGAAGPGLVPCADDSLSVGAYRDIATPVIEAQAAFYSSGDDGSFAGLTTPSGLVALSVMDWRYRAVRDSDVRFMEEPRLVDFDDWQEWCTDDGTLVSVQLDPIIDIEAGARTIDAAAGRTLERVGGMQRRGFSYTFVQADDGGGWLLDAASPPTAVPGFAGSAPARPCPGLQDRGRAADAFLAEPWCTAGGEGRLVPGSGAGAELSVGRPSCLRGAHEIKIGLPPGTVPGFDSTAFYIRDPSGRAPRAFRRDGFRRDIRPPHDAISTGITNGRATIWTSETLGDDWLLVQVGKRFERWPRSIGGCGPA